MITQNDIMLSANCVLSPPNVYMIVADQPDQDT